jgi:hypothetical protein
MLDKNSYKFLETKVEQLNFPENIQYRIRDRKKNTFQLEKRMGKGKGYFQRIFKKLNPEVSILVTMSIELEYNLFEMFLGILPEHIRATRKEKQLQEEIANLKKELENITAQRDLLIKIATKGG